MDLLRRAIVGAEFAPGERLTERVLCERFAVSRTVVTRPSDSSCRNASRTTVPQRGPVVAVLSAADAASLYEVRAVLEALAGRAFAERATPPQRDALRAALDDVESLLDGGGPLADVLAAKDRFYDALLDGAHNEVARAALRGVHARTSLLRGLTLRAAGRPAQTRRELRAIADAAVSGDGSAAWHACEDHVRSAAAVAAELMRTEGQP